MSEGLGRSNETRVIEFWGRALKETKEKRQEESAPRRHTVPG